MQVIAIAFTLMLGVSAMARAQSPASATTTTEGTTPTFDVVSIRSTSSTEHDRTHIWSSPGDGDFRAQNVSIADLLEFAFALPDSRFLAHGEAKDLLRAPRFDLQAKSTGAVNDHLRGLAPEAAKEEKRKMVQGLLADRFQLESHTETRELPIYTLVVTKGGPKFSRSQAKGTTYSMGRGSLRIEGGGSTVEMMAANLAAVLGRPVVNQTGIEGNYLMQLRWMPDDGPAPLLNGGPDTSLPSIFTAVEEQLGLKLVSGKGPVMVLVVDAVHLPSPN